ncbi:MAG: hypothetical protein ACR2PT_16870 [Endozoicomonas sp.]
MKPLPQFLFILLMTLGSTALSAAEKKTNTEVLKEYIQGTYGERLTISDNQIEQLTWVMENPARTPEMDTRNGQKASDIHREVPRALARLYALQLMRSGTDRDYQAFTAPQKGLDVMLNQESFALLSSGISRLDEESYETLEAAVIISAVTLSPKAREKASAVLKEPFPKDSEKFLTFTARKAAAIYPLAEQVTQKYKSDGRKFKIIYFPDSHLRHMMYNEGSASMYSTLREGLRTKKLRQADLDLWYYRWVANIAGFRGHLSDLGSLYLTQNTFMAMNQLKNILDRLRLKTDLNPMEVYLEHRGRWLGLYALTRKRDERLALTSLGATLRLFAPADGKILKKAFRELSARDQERWIRHTEKQMTETGFPAPTYGPALFTNALDVTDLAETLKKMLPLFLDAMDQEQQLRSKGRLPRNTPISFRSLSTTDSIRAILSTSRPLAVKVDTDTGLVTAHER